MKIWGFFPIQSIPGKGHYHCDAWVKSSRFSDAAAKYFKVRAMPNQTTHNTPLKRLIIEYIVLWLIDQISQFK